MKLIVDLLIGVVALEHLYILWIEMFAWESKGKETFGTLLSSDLFKSTKVMAANQGLYNGFLASGLIWTFFISDRVWQSNISIFFLSCVVIADIYGALTAVKKIFYVQALPAIVALIATIVYANSLR